MTFPTVCKPAISWGLTLASLFNSCKTNERATASNRIRAANGFDDEPGRRFFVAAAIPRPPPDARADRRRVTVAGAVAGGCLSRSFTAARRNHHAMARPRRRGSGTAHHRARRSRNERHPKDDHATLHLALWLVRCPPHLSQWHGQQFRAPGSFQPAVQPQSAERRYAFGVAAVVTFRSDLSLCAAKLRPVADGTQNVRGLDHRT